MFSIKNKLAYSFIFLIFLITIASACDFFTEDTAIKTIETIETINVSQGITANEIIKNKLPETIEVVLSDNSTETVEIDWRNHNYDKDKAGSYYFAGTFMVNDIADSIRAEVIVKENNIEATTLDNGLDENEISNNEQDIYIKAEQEYNNNEDVEIKVFNNTDETLSFSNLSLGLEVEKKINGQWEVYDLEIYCYQDEFELASKKTAQVTIKANLISEPGNYRVTFNSLEGSTGEVSLSFKQANFQIKDITITPDEITEKDDIEITAKIENTGDISDTQNIQLSFTKLDSEWGVSIPPLSKEISLEPGDKYDLVFDNIEHDFSPGEYQAEISSNNNQDKIDFEVLAVDSEALTN